MRTITSYTIVLAGRPVTVNAERRLHFHQRSDVLKKWRDQARVVASALNVPPVDMVRITACPWLKGRRSQDVAACLPSVKAAIDGLVDAGVLPDDTPSHVVNLSFLPPVLGAEIDELVLTLEVVR